MFKLVVFAAVLATAFGVPKPYRPRLDGRIVGGEDTTIEEHPHQISLLQYGTHICGGSVINENTVVTAAHCTYGATAEQLSVRAGSAIKNSGGVVIDVEEIFPHPDFSYGTLDYDVTVVRLANSLNFGDNIQPIGLWSEDPEDGALSQCTGWGALTEGGSSPSQLQVVSVPIVNRDECNTAYGGSITYRMICAGYPEGGKDACQGDSGGPLITDGKLSGIVSWGSGCARPGYAGVYSDVANLHSYIIEFL